MSAEIERIAVTDCGSNLLQCVGVHEPVETF
jgi:hypothetical protein